MDFKQSISIALVMAACASNGISASAFTKDGGDGRTTVHGVTSDRPRYKVTGNVRDNNGEPIVGASVFVEGRSGGTVSDIDGRFAIMGDGHNHRLRT